MAPRRTFKEWFKKYFLEGQALNESQKEALETLDPNAPWHKKLLVKHRRIIGVLIPFSIVHFIWWNAAIRYNFWQLFPENDRYLMTITMIFGGMVAGMTSEGGGAVAFPVLTLAFNVAPSIARDFSLMIQTTGMSCASFAIFFMKIQVEWRSLLFCCTGSFIGIIFGLEQIDPRLTPAQKKMGFVSIFFAFAFALFLLNRYHKRRTFTLIPEFKAWKAIVLLITGLVGGILSAVAGSGADICSFSILTLLFRVTEKTATPTSVVLMASTSAVGVFWRQVIMQTVDIEAWKYLAVCGEIVVLGAPLGAVLGSHFHRQVLAALVYILDTAALIGAFAIVDQTPGLTGASVGIIVAGFAFFGMLSYFGNRIMQSIPEDYERKDDQSSAQKPTAIDNEAYVLSDEKIQGPSNAPHSVTTYM